MRLVLGLLGAVLAALFIAAVVHGYQVDQRTIRWFSGTGVAGKLDVLGPPPDYLLIQDDHANLVARTSVAGDGTFVARLRPGTYRFSMPDGSRSMVVVVQRGECIDLVLDFRLPMLVLEVPREGWPLPRPALE